MPFKSIKSKIEQMTNGERLGEMESEEELEQKERSQRTHVQKRPETKKTNEEPKEKTKKEEKGGFFSRKENSEKEKPEKQKKEKKSIFQKQEKKQTPNPPQEEKKKEAPRKASELIGAVKRDSLEEGYLDVLEILNIKPVSKVDVEMNSNDMDYIEFTQTTPLGFSFEEVTDFIARTKYIYKTYENQLRKRDADVQILASEVKKVEKRMMEQNQEKEMEKMIGGMTEEERLIEENLDLKVQINELTNKLNSPSKSESNVVKELKKKIEILTQENEMLIMSQNSSLEQISFQSKKEISSGLPSMGDVKEQASISLPSFDISNTGEQKKDGSDYLENLMQLGTKRESKEVDAMDKMIKQMGGEEDYD